MREREIKAVILKEIDELRRFLRSLEEKSLELNIDSEKERLCLAISAQIKILDKVYNKIK